MALRYLYCVVPSSSPPDLSGWSGEGAPLELVLHDGIAGVVGHVPTERYGARALAKASGSLDTLAPYATAHQSVVQFVFERAPAVVPMSFGSVHKRAGDVRAALETEAERLRDLLQRFAGMQEWGLRVARRDRALRPPASSGTEYLAARRAELRGELAARARDVVDRLENAIAETAAARRVLDQGSGDLLLRVAYLVPAPLAERAKRLVVEAGPALEEQDVAVELSGPWPPYSFVRG